MIKPIEFDRSYWHTDDPQWLAERERKWSLYLSYMASINGWSKEWDEQPQKDAWKDYYLYGNVHKDHKAWQDLCLLHPEPTAASLNPLIEQLQRDFRGYCNFLGTVYSCYPLVEAGFFSADHLRQLYLVLQGSNYRESAEILGFDAERSVEKAVEDIAQSLSNWRKAKDPEHWPIDLLMQHYKSIFCEIRLSHLPRLEFTLDMHIRNIIKFSVKYPSTNQLKIDNMEDFKAFLFSSDVDPCVTGIASRYLHPNGDRKI